MSPLPFDILFENIVRHRIIDVNGFYLVSGLFYGIKITMYWNEHNPPHFYAEYGKYKAVFAIDEGIIIKGNFPKKQLKFVLAWAELHKDELMQNWELAKENKPLNRINPLI